MKYGIVLYLPALLLLKSLFYWGAFSIRKLGVPFWTVILVAGGPIAFGVAFGPVLGVALLLFPSVLRVAVGVVVDIAFTVYLSMKYGSVPLFPDAAVICTAIEVGMSLASWLVSDKILQW